MITRKTGVAVLSGAAILGAHQAMAQSAPAPRMNVLFMVADDLNTHLACYGDPVVKTPNLDRLAARGVLFHRAYCQYPVCNPSRTSFLSGLHPETTKVCDQQTQLRRDRMPAVVYLPEHFRAAGYFTAGIGKVEHAGHHEIKWDVADDFKSGDDEAETPTTRPAARRRARAASGDAEVTRRLRGDGLPYTVERQTDENDPENVDDQIAARVAALLEQRAADGKRFFIVAGFHKPHVPHVAPKRFFDMYPLEKMPVVDVPPDDAADIPQAALASKKNYQPDMPLKQKREIVRAYYACTSYMDEKVGEVLATMDRLKLWDNTVVVFIGDNGWSLGEHNWWAKASLFEDSAREVLIMAAPGTKPAVCPRVVEFVDLYPTLTELCALPKPPQGEGRSIAPLLEDPRRPWEGVAYTALGQGPLGRSVRTERYRYTEWDQGRRGIELYDHDIDPRELKNLAKSPEHQTVVEQMRKLLREGPATRPAN